MNPEGVPKYKYDLWKQITIEDKRSTIKTMQCPLSLSQTETMTLNNTKEMTPMQLLTNKQIINHP